MNKFIIVLSITFMLGIWTMDVAVTTINMGGGRGILTNGFWDITTSQGYHMGMYLAILSFVIAIFVMDFENKSKFPL